MCENYNFKDVQSIYDQANSLHTQVIKLTGLPTTDSGGVRVPLPDLIKSQQDETELLGCIQQKLIESDVSLNNLLNNYETSKIGAITASEMNNNTKTLYQVDLYYTIGKSFLFICLFATYFYFFKITGIIEPIKNGINLVKNKVTKLTDVKMPKNIPDITAPEIKMPEPTIKPSINANIKIKNTNAFK